MTKEDRDRAQARADKVARAAEDARSGKAERDAAAKAVLDNMAKLKAHATRARGGRATTRAGRKGCKEAARRHQAAEPRSRWPCPTGWLASRTADGEPEIGHGSKIRRYAGPGQSIIDRVLFSAS